MALDHPDSSSIARTASSILLASVAAVVAIAGAARFLPEQPERPDYPDEAMRFRRLQSQDENGQIPGDALLRAKAHVDQMRAAAEIPPVAGISAPKWQWLGPGNIGGRTRTIVVNPSTPSTWFAGSVGGGIWKTTDSGASWAPVNDFLANLSVSTMIIQPGNPNIMYAGTGEGFYNGDGLQGNGIFKSIDGGNTWTQLPFTNNANFYYVNRLSMSPDGAVLLAATRSGLWRSTDGGNSFAFVLNKYSGVGLADVDFCPTNGSLAVASDQAGDAFWSNDGGQTWTPATGLGTSSGSFQRVEVAWAASSPLTVYAVADLNSGTLYRSNDGGVTYGLVGTTGNHLSGQGWYDNALWVDPTNANYIVVGGLDLWRSTSGGAPGTFTKISNWTAAPNSAHADHHVIVELPGFRTTNTSVLFGNDGGVYMATNIDTVGGGISPYTAGWLSMNHNYGVTQYYGVAGNATSGTIIGGTQDNGTLKYTPAGGPQAHTVTFGGDGGFMAADPTDPNYFYGEYVALSIFRSSNGGASASFIDADITDRAYFIAPFILDPNNPNTLLGGATGLWRSTAAKDPTVHFTKIRADVSANYAISAIAVATGNSDNCWLGYGDGEVWSSPNCTAPTPGWTRLDLNPGGMPKRYINRVEIDPSNPNHVYVAFGGYTTSNLWQTLDGGLSWSANASGSGVNSLPPAPVRDIKVTPGRPLWVYAGTDVGVFASQDGGLNWKIPQDGPANVAVDQLAWVGPSLVAATHGRGLYKVTPTSRTFSDFNGDGLADLAVYRASTGTWMIQNHSDVALGGVNDIPVPGDYDGDGVNDVAVFHPSTGVWDIQGSASVPFGAPGDIPVPADYDGDGKTDIAVFRPSSGTWFINGVGAIPFGAAGDIPVPADYNGTGRAQIAVYRRGVWYILGQSGIAWGTVGDIPVPGDYNGDGKADVAIFRPATGTWFVRNLFSLKWGTAGDLPVPQDLDGDGRVELTLFRPSSAIWFSYNTRTGVTSGQSFGASDDLPIAGVRFRRAIVGDLDGDRRSEVTVFRPADATWRSLLSSASFGSGPTVPFGVGTDTPLLGDFLGLRRTQRAIYRNGIWAISGAPAPLSLGSASDTPIVADFDGDGKDDIAIFQSGQWKVAFSSTSFTTSSTYAWGTTGDTPIAGDFDGDGRADLAIFRAGAWYILRSTTNYDYASSISVLWGATGDVPIAGDYDGDGLMDVAIYRPADGAWYMRASSTGGMLVQVFGGVAGDVPVPGDYDGDGRTDVAILRGSTQKYYVLAQFGTNFGAAGDIPLLQPR